MDGGGAAVPERLDADPEEIRRRLEERLLRVRSVWFPTPRELTAWKQSGHLLYVRFRGPAEVEVGPRLESMWASCFSPVDVVRFDGPVTVRRQMPSFTLGIVGVWWLATLAWGAIGLPRVASGEEPPAWLAFFAIVALSSTLGPLVGWVMGGRTLDERRHAWVEAISVPRVDEDW